jgi:hypothetical protein
VFRRFARSAHSLAVLLVAACGGDPAAPVEPPFAPSLPPGVTLRYSGELPAFPRLASACDAAALDRARAESRARAPRRSGWTAAERAAIARDVGSRVYGVQEPDYFWLVRATGANQERHQRSRLQVGLRAGVTPAALGDALRSVGAIQWGQPSGSTALPLRVDVSPGTERPALLALLSDCRIRYVTFETQFWTASAGSVARGG